MRILAALAVCLAALPTVLAHPEVGQVYQRVRSSVVVIETRGREVDPHMGRGLVSTGGIGSGVLVSDDGKVLTAAHVVQTADRIEVTFTNDETIEARVLASEPSVDVALIQLARLPTEARPAPLGDSDDAEVGDQVFVVGAPLGISHSLTVGYISGRRLDNLMHGSMTQAEMFQTDAAINQGNSGGPMFNIQGEVIGVVSHIISQGGGSEGLGFVITSNVARRLLLEGRSMWSGLNMQILDGGLARLLNLPQGRGLLVLNVAERSPGSLLGLHGGSVSATIDDNELVLGGDVILEVLGISVASDDFAESIRAKLAKLTSGAPLEVKILRAGEVLELKSYYFPDLLVPTATGGSP